MPDFKERLMGPDYHGPSKQTIYEFITMFGTRKGCTKEELFMQFGKLESSQWHSLTSTHLAALAKQGKVIVGETWIGIN